MWWWCRQCGQRSMEEEEEEGAMASYSLLPTEIVERIFLFLPLQTVMVMMLVCR